MASRREFLRYAMALSAAVAAPRASFANAVAATGAPVLFTVLVDRALEASAAFAGEAARRGAAVQMIGADVGSVWMNVIEPRLRLGPTAIAGFTHGAPLFCLELLARDYGLRLVYRVEHSPLADGRFAHRITGAEPSIGCAGALAGAGERWPAAAAALATSCPPSVHPPSDVALLDLSEHSDRARQSLFSWVIAPRARSRVV